MNIFELFLFLYAYFVYFSSYIFRVLQILNVRLKCDLSKIADPYNSPLTLDPPLFKEPILYYLIFQDLKLVNMIFWNSSLLSHLYVRMDHFDNDNWTSLAFMKRLKIIITHFRFIKRTVLLYKTIRKR